MKYHESAWNVTTLKSVCCVWLLATTIPNFRSVSVLGHWVLWYFTNAAEKIHTYFVNTYTLGWPFASQQQTAIGKSRSLCRVLMRKWVPAFDILGKKLYNKDIWWLCVVSWWDGSYSNLHCSPSVLTAFVQPLQWNTVTSFCEGLSQWLLQWGPLLQQNETPHILTHRIVHIVVAFTFNKTYFSIKKYIITEVEALTNNQQDPGWACRKLNTRASSFTKIK